MNSQNIKCLGGFLHANVCMIVVVVFFFLPMFVTNCSACLDAFVATSVASTPPQPPLRSIAFCSISTGVYMYPKRAACRVAIDAVINWLRVSRQTFSFFLFAMRLE